MRSIWRIGLTGGIGSGKSTVAAMLAEHGATVIDADAVARQITAAGGSAIEPILSEFGPTLISADGALDRAHMRALAFTDPDARRRLEHIVHPLVGQETERLTKAALAAGHHCIVHDIPLLVESGRWRPRLDRVLVVDCRTDTQIERTMQRSGLARTVVEQIMTAQASREQRLRAADCVLYNDDLSLHELTVEVEQIARRFGL